MKKFLSIILALFMTFNLTSCFQRRGVFMSKRSDLYAISCYSVPFITGSLDWDKLEIVEQDSQGRLLYKYTSETKYLSDISGQYVYAIIICQKSDENFAYYYDNYNFLLSRDGNFFEQDVENLKRQNDWNKTLAEEKMVKVQNTFYPYKAATSYNEKAFLDYNMDTILSIWKPYLNSKQDYVLDLIAVDSNSKFLFAVREVGDDGFKNSYFVICNSNFEIESSKDVQEINDIFNCQETLHVFKERNHWEALR